jgi:transposase-like protein
MSSVAVKAPVLVPFVCPICAATNEVQLVALSRAGGMNCQHCAKRLRIQDVMRAMHSPRPPK